MNDNAQIILTADGSPTLYLPELDETYHSRHGAEQESRHVFVQKGLDAFQGEEPIRLLEVGMGTGLNVLLTSEWARKTGRNIKMTTLEPYPLKEELYTSLRYGSSEARTNDLRQIHQVEWEKNHQIDSSFELRKSQRKLLDFEGEETFNLVFYDAFGPRAQAEMWDLTHAQKLASLTSKGAILVTYCSQGQFRRNLKSVGFEVSKIDGPPGKREMVRAIKL